MNSISANQIRRFLKEIVQVGIILSLCFRVSGSPTTRAQEADTQTEPPTNGSLSIEKQSISQFGWFSVIWGDGLDGASHTIYTLTDNSGHTTVLLLD
jgi:hypothetical protein